MLIIKFEFIFFSFSWSPLDALRYCIARTECKLIIVDPERADKLEPIAKSLTSEAGSNGILVLEAHEGKGKWTGMKTWRAAFDDYRDDPRKILSIDPNLTPEDNATILFTSGLWRALGFRFNLYISWRV